MYPGVKITVDLPKSLLSRIKVVADQRNTSVNDFIVHGLVLALRSPGERTKRAALVRLRRGLKMNESRATRAQLHERV
jgi:hypothetical protein